MHSCSISSPAFSLKHLYTTSSSSRCPRMSEETRRICKCWHRTHIARRNSGMSIAKSYLQRCRRRKRPSKCQWCVGILPPLTTSTTCATCSTESIKIRPRLRTSASRGPARNKRHLRWQQYGTQVSYHSPSCRRPASPRSCCESR